MYMNFMKCKCKIVVKFFTFGFVFEKEYWFRTWIDIQKESDWNTPPHPLLIQVAICFFFIFYSFPGSLVASDISAALGPLQNPL